MTISFTRDSGIEPFLTNSVILTQNAPEPVPPGIDYNYIEMKI